MRIVFLAAVVTGCAQSAPPEREASKPPADIPPAESAGECGDRGVAAVLGDFGYTRVIEAVSAAQNNDTITVCPGRWPAGRLVVKDQTVTLTSASGSADDTVLVGDTSSRIVSFEYSDSTLSHLTFEGGTGQADYHPTPVGGAIAGIASSLHITGCVFHDNDSGAIAFPGIANDIEVTIEDSVFRHDGTGATPEQAALYVGWIELDILDSRFTSDGTTLAVWTGGRPFRIEGSEFVDAPVLLTQTVNPIQGAIVDSTFERSPVSLLSDRALSLSVDGSTFSGTTGTSAIHMKVGDRDNLVASFSNVTFTGNATADGSAIRAEGVSTSDVYLNLDGVSISNHDDGATGAAISVGSVFDLGVDLQNCTVTNNNSIGVSVAGTSAVGASVTSQGTSWSNNAHTVKWDGVTYDFTGDFLCESDSNAAQCQ